MFLQELFTSHLKMNATALVAYIHVCMVAICLVKEIERTKQSMDSRSSHQRSLNSNLVCYNGFRHSLIPMQV